MLKELREKRGWEVVPVDVGNQIGFAVYDLAREPERAEADHVVFTPTLVKRRPEPRAWILGDLSDPSVLTDLLHMCGIEPRP